MFYRFTGLIGTPVHELAHAIGCLLFGMRITGIRLFSLSKHADPMGYVSFAYSPHSLRHQIGCLVQGVAPLIASGALVTYFLNVSVPLAPPHITLSSMAGWFYLAATGALSQLFELASLGWQGAFCSFLLACVALHGIPSVADIKISMVPLTVFILGGAAVLALVHALFGWDLSGMGQWPLAGWIVGQVERFFWWLIAASGAVVALAMISGFLFLVIPGLVAHLLKRMGFIGAGAKT